MRTASIRRPWRDAGTGEKVLSIADPAPEGRAWEPVWFDNPVGQRIQGLVPAARR